MVADEISSLRLMLSENRISGFEGVCGEDDVELTRFGVSRWIDRWMFHRWWLETGGTSCCFTGTAAPFSVSRISLVRLLGLVCNLSLPLVDGLCNFWTGPIN